MLAGCGSPSPHAEAVTACHDLGRLVADVRANAPAPTVLREANDAATRATAASRHDLRWVQLASAAQGVLAALRANSGQLAGISIRIGALQCAAAGVHFTP